MSTEPLVLVGLSISDTNARDDLLSVADRLGASVAFLQLAEPTLSTELDRLADLGHDRVRLVGLATGLIAPGHSWLRRVAGYWWRSREGHRPDLDVVAGLAEVVTTDAVTTLLAGSSRLITGDEPGLTSAPWEDVPTHRHQVLVCRGPRCSAQGAEAVLRGVVLGLVEHGLGDDDVLVTHTGCQFPCNQAPVISVQPDDVWYGGVDEQMAGTIVTEHLVNGRPVSQRRLPRSRS